MQPALPTSHPHPDLYTDIRPTSANIHADNQKSGQAALEGAEGKGKTFPLEMQLDGSMQDAARTCATDTAADLKPWRQAGVELFPPWFDNS